MIKSGEDSQTDLSITEAFLLIGNAIKSGEDSQTYLRITEALLKNGSVEVVRTFTASDD